MRFDIMTLFDQMVDNILHESIIGRAEKKGIIEIHTHNIRNYSKDKHRRVDDTVCGGGFGMLMSPVPIYDCYNAILDMHGENYPKKRVIYMSPQGKPLTQAKAKELSENYDSLIILCGHYEGVDERIIDKIVDEEISIGDYVLTGGELPACVLVDCVSRLIKGVLSDEECYTKESHSDFLLEEAQYTRPIDFMGDKVPDVLISGHHKNIEAWKKRNALERTKAKRPDLYRKYIRRHPDEKI